MINLKYNINMPDDVVFNNLKRITNQTYKLLPLREEKLDWQTPLTTILEELSGLNSLLIDFQNILLPVLCKLEGLMFLTQESDFFLYRRTIFECLSLINSIMQALKEVK